MEYFWDVFEGILEGFSIVLGEVFRRQQTNKKLNKAYTNLLNPIKQRRVSKGALYNITAKHASHLWTRKMIRFSNSFGIICMSGGYQDLLPGLYLHLARDFHDLKSKTYQEPIREKM